MLSYLVSKRNVWERCDMDDELLVCLDVGQWKWGRRLILGGHYGLSVSAHPRRGKEYLLPQRGNGIVRVSND